MAAVPYFAAWLVALVGAMLAMRWLPRRRTALRSSVLLIGPVLLYLSGILLGTDEAYLAGVRGVAFAAIALVWLAWRRGATVEASGEGAARLRGRRSPDRRGRRGRRRDRRRRGPRARPGVARSLRAARRGRAAVRPAGVPEPARGLPHVHEGPRRDPLFEVSGLEPGDVIRLATMDSYTGRLWNVAGPPTVGRRRRRIRDRRHDAARPALAEPRQPTRSRSRSTRTTTCGCRPSATDRRSTCSTRARASARATCATTPPPARPCSRAGSRRAPGTELDAARPAGARRPTTSSTPRRDARAPAGREPARRGRREGRRVRRRRGDARSSSCARSRRG